MGFTEKSDFKGGGAKKGVWAVCRFKESKTLLGKKEGSGVFEGVGWYHNAHYGEKNVSTK